MARKATDGLTVVEPMIVDGEEVTQEAPKLRITVEVNDPDMLANGAEPVSVFEAEGLLAFVTTDVDLQNSRASTQVSQWGPYDVNGVVDGINSLPTANSITAGLLRTRRQAIDMSLNVLEQAGR